MVGRCGRGGGGGGPAGPPQGPSTTQAGPNVNVTVHGSLTGTGPATLAREFKALLDKTVEDGA